MLYSLYFLIFKREEQRFPLNTGYLGKWYNSENRSIFNSIYGAVTGGSKYGWEFPQFLNLKEAASVLNSHINFLENFEFKKLKIKLKKEIEKNPYYTMMADNSFRRELESIKKYRLIVKYNDKIIYETSCGNLDGNGQNYRFSYIFTIMKLNIEDALKNFDRVKTEISQSGIFKEVFNKKRVSNKKQSTDKTINDKNNGKVYFLNAKGTKRFKIGFTKSTVHKRKQELQTGCPFELIVVCEFEATLEEEKILHKNFSHIHVVGEWFEDNGVIIEFLKDRMSNEAWEDLKYAVGQ